MTTRQSLFNDNINLAYKLAHKYKKIYTQFTTDEVIQFALIALWKSTKVYNPKFNNTLSALYNKVFVNELNMACRKPKRIPPTIPLEEAYQLSVTDDHFNPAKEQVANILIKLNNLEKTIVALKLEGLTQSEIGSRLNKSQVQISRQLKRIKEKL